METLNKNKEEIEKILKEIEDLKEYNKTRLINAEETLKFDIDNFNSCKDSDNYPLIKDLAEQVLNSQEWVKERTNKFTNSGLDLKKALKERIKTSILWCEFIEDKLDKLNGEKGNLCLYCNAKKYNGKVGIIHENNCLIIQLRNHLKWLKQQEKEI